MVDPTPAHAVAPLSGWAAVSVGMPVSAGLSAGSAALGKPPEGTVAVNGKDWAWGCVTRPLPVGNVGIVEGVEEGKAVEGKPAAAGGKGDGSTERGMEALAVGWKDMAAGWFMGIAWPSRVAVGSVGTAGEQGRGGIARRLNLGGGGGRWAGGTAEALPSCCAAPLPGSTALPTP